MAKAKGTIKVDLERCKGCEVCIVACPQSVIALNAGVNRKGYRYAYMENPDSCTGCSNCGIVCPDGVITVFRIKQE